MSDLSTQALFRWPADASKPEVHARLTPPDDALPPAVVASVRDIIAGVRARGDDALIEYGEAFDKVTLTAAQLRVTQAEIDASAAKASASLKAAIRTAIQNIRAFHEPQRPESFELPRPDGASLGFLWRPVQSAALYVPGGRAAYPSTVLMNAIPAQVAGVERLVVLTVPGMVENNAAVAFALQELGLTEVYRVAGAQSVAAAAYGTASLPPVDVIVGPGNAYVAAAKREVFGRVGIDAVAGPSEVLILADESAVPAWVAQDLIAQAEHDPLARCVLAVSSEAVARAVLEAFEARLKIEPRREIIEAAWRDHGLVLIAEDREAMLSLTRSMAPEHLQVMLNDPPAPEQLVAGAIFIGNYAPTAAGDYIAGPNHVLPTGATARFSGPLGVHAFLRPSSVVKASRGWIAEIAAQGAEIADHEQLTGHAAALRMRLDDTPDAEGE